MRNNLEVGDILRQFGPLYRDAYGARMLPRHFRAMRAMEICRTAELGGHMDECDSCGHQKPSYNSCRNRHCPKCGSLDKERWLDARRREILPVQYHHVVVTVPDKLRLLGLRNQRVFYNLLFKSLSETLLELARDPKHLGAHIGFWAILHTWSQTMWYHPHIHCIVPSGGFALDGSRWIEGKKDFFIHFEVLSRKFRGKFLYYLKEAYYAGKFEFSSSIEYLRNKPAFEKLLNTLYAQDWVAYSKPSFKCAETVVDYLGKYTHRVAISNHRLIKLEGDRVTFEYRDSNDGNKTNEMTLDALEFIDRFLQHVLPERFVKIRYYGILSNRNKKGTLGKCREFFGTDKMPVREQNADETWQELLERVTGIDPTRCQKCGKGKMRFKEFIPKGASRSPP